MLFNPDGSLKATKHHRDHLPVLKTISEIPFGLGKKLIIDHLRGRTNAKTARLRLDRYTTFGDLGGHEEEEIEKLLLLLEGKKLIEKRKEKGLYTIFALTAEGEEELRMPQLEIDLNNLQERTSIHNPFERTTITEQEKNAFEHLHDFFPTFNDQQKKAVVSPEHNILCVAGAGSGKTSVLTKRIEFLIRYRSVEPRKILAITFTRKARKEMQQRLGDTDCRVETFNSLCEKILLRYGDPHQEMISIREKISLLIEALKDNNTDQETLLRSYYTTRQRAGKDNKTLFFSFAYDFNTLIDRIKLTDKTIEELRKDITRNQEHAALAHLLLDIARTYLNKTSRYRDYADQLMHTLRLLQTRPELIPRFEHILVDEYQDVNDQQLSLLELLGPANLFVVGDPRQSIYGWRGSRIEHILEFQKKHSAQVIELSTNYRSSRKIIELCNTVAEKTGYEPLTAATNSEGNVRILHFKTEEEQATVVGRAIHDHEGDRKDIMVLSRTNKGLDKVREQLDLYAIPYLLRTEELRRPGIEASPGQVTLATVHAIKGLEAKKVFVINANMNNFPCKAQDHPVMDLFRLTGEYDSYAEELRVLYVALSRAQEELILTYTGTLSPFLPSTQGPAMPKKDTTVLMMNLRTWRLREAHKRGCPSYIICSDRTLQALAQQQPHTLEDLHSIHGLGPAKIEEFGEDILLALDRHL